MKSNITSTVKAIAKGLIILICGVVAGTILLTSVYALPVERMHDHVEQAAELLVEEGAYPRLYGGQDIRMNPENFLDLKVMLLNTRGMARDNITDATMLNIAVYPGEGNALERAMLAERPVYEDCNGVATEELKRYMDGDTGYAIQEYSRYWHGYLVVLKPLLLLFRYEQIRWLNVGWMLFLLAAVLWSFLQRGSRENMLLWCYTLLFTVPVIIPLCMQYCTVSYVMLGAMLWMLRRGYTLDDRRTGYFFLVVGLLTAYVDFLTFPLMSLGLPLVYLLNRSYASKLKDKILRVLQCGIAWGIGYAGMWASKWVVASLLLRRNLIGEAVEQVVYRSSSTPDVGEFSISPLRALASNLSCFTNVYFLVLIAVGLAMVLILRKKAGIKAWNWNACIPYLCICIVPVVWTMLFKNHSYGHGSFTYRMFTMTIYSGMSMLLFCGRRVEPAGGDEGKKRRILILNGRYLPGYKDGGPVRSIKNLTDRLGEKYDFRILTVDRDHGDKTAYPGICYGEWQRVGNADVMYVVPGGFTAKVVKDAAVWADVVYICGCYNDYARMALRLKRDRWYPAKVIVASMGSFSPGAFGRKNLKKKLYILWMKCSGRFRMVEWSATDEMEAANIRNVIGKKAVCRIAHDLPRQVDLSLTPTMKDQVLRVIFLSRISDEKNLSYALEVLGQITGKAEFDIYGSKHDPEYFQKCMDLAKKLPDNITVKYCGEAESERVPEIFSRYQVFLFPTMGENYGHVIYEALTGGCIPVISDRTSWKDLEENGVGSVIPLEEPEKFVQAIQTIADMSPGDCYAQQQKAQEYVREYSLHVDSSGYEEMFDTHHINF